MPKSCTADGVRTLEYHGRESSTRCNLDNMCKWKKNSKLRKHLRQFDSEPNTETRCKHFLNPGCFYNDSSVQDCGILEYSLTFMVNDAKLAVDGGLI